MSHSRCNATPDEADRLAGRGLMPEARDDVPLLSPVCASFRDIANHLHTGLPEQVFKVPTFRLVFKRRENTGLGIRAADSTAYAQQRSPLHWVNRRYWAGYEDEMSRKMPNLIGKTAEPNPTHGARVNWI